MLALVAMVQILNGIAAIAEDTLFLTGYDYVFAFDLTTWGWVSLVLGLLAGAMVRHLDGGSCVLLLRSPASSGQGDSSEHLVVPGRSSTRGSVRTWAPWTRAPRSPPRLHETFHVTTRTILVRGV